MLTLSINGKPQFCLSDIQLTMIIHILGGRPLHNIEDCGGGGGGKCVRVGGEINYH